MEYDPDTMKIRICKKCKGLGLVPGPNGKDVKCPDCRGAGRIVLKTLESEFPLGSLGENVSFDEETMKVTLCKTCGGLGTLKQDGEERECGECNGTGRIIKQKIVTEYQIGELENLQ